MTNAVTPAQTPAKTSQTRRSHALEAELARARTIEAALPSLLAGIAAKDAKAAKVRIDSAWLESFSSVIASAESGVGAGGVARIEQKTATAEERATALQLSLLLTDTRELVATHNPDDLAAQQAYGRGEKIDPRRTSALETIAGGYLAAWDGKWKVFAVDAGITQATMDQIKSLRDALAQASVGQHSVMQANEDATLSREGALAALRPMSAFAVRVVASVFGKGSREAASLSDPRPLTSHASGLKARTRAKKVTTAATKKAKKAAAKTKPGARAATAQGRAKRATIAKRAAAVLAASKPAAKARKPAKKAKAAPSRAKKPASKAKRAK